MHYDGGLVPFAFQSGIQKLMLRVKNCETDLI